MLFFWGPESTWQILCLLHSERRQRQYPRKNYIWWSKLSGAFSLMMFCFLIFFFSTYIFCYCHPVSSYLTRRRTELYSWHQFCAQRTLEFSHCHHKVINAWDWVFQLFVLIKKFFSFFWLFISQFFIDPGLSRQCVTIKLEKMFKRTRNIIKLPWHNESVYSDTVVQCLHFTDEEVVDRQCQVLDYW